MWKILLVLFLTIIFTVFILIISVNAQPTSGLYPFRRVTEKIVLLTKHSPLEKSKYYRYLLDERLLEVKSTYGAKDSIHRLSSALRYSTTAGILTEIIVSNHLTEEIPVAERQFRNHIHALSHMAKTYPYSEKKFLEDDIHYLEHYLESLKNM